MDYDMSALTKLKEEMRLRQQRHATGPRPANEAMTSQIKMIVSNWYTDEPGNRARFLKRTLKRRSKSPVFLSIRRRRVDSLASQAHDYVDASDFVALRR